MPSEISTVDQFVQVLRSQGNTVSTGEKIDAKLYLAPGRQVLVNGTSVTVFEYGTPNDAQSAAETLTAGHLPNPTAIPSWIDVVHVYQTNRVVVIYQGCGPTTLEALERAVGRPSGVLGQCKSS